MVENQKTDLKDLGEPLRKLTGIDFSMGEDGLLRFDGDLSRDQYDRLYKLGELDVIDVEVSADEESDHKSYKVTAGNKDTLDYIAAGHDDGTIPDAGEFETVLNQASVMGGELEDDDPDAIEKKRRKRQEQYNNFHQAGTGFGAAAVGTAVEEDKAPPDDSNDPEKNSRTLLGKAGHYFGLGVSSGFNGVWAGQNSKGQISDRQLKAMIKIGVLEKGYDTLHFYDRRSKQIDPNLSSRAQQIITKMQRRGELSADVSVSMQPQDVKPWNYLFRETRQGVADFKKGVFQAKDKAVDAATKPVSRTMHNWGWKQPMKEDFAKAHDNKTSRTRTHTADEEAAAGQHAANNPGPGASPA